MPARQNARWWPRANLIRSRRNFLVSLNRRDHVGNIFPWSPVRRTVRRSVRGRSGMLMPVLRYFVFVGGALLALLLVCNAVLPQAPLPETLKSVSDMPSVRIKSER